MARIIENGNGFNGVYMTEIRNNYVNVMYIDGKFVRIIPNAEAVSLKRHIRENGHENIVRVVVENRRERITVPECAFCAARPQTGEYDCDGFHYTSSCDSEQCKPADVRKGRRNLSASSRARGFDS